MCAERVGDRRQRLADMACQHCLIGQVVRYLAQPVHIVGKGKQAGRQVRQTLESPPDHRRAHHFAEGADMRQAGGAIAGLEQGIALGRDTAGEPVVQSAGFFKGPGLGGERDVMMGHDAALRPRVTPRQRSSAP